MTDTKPVDREILQTRITSITGNFTKEKSVWDIVSDFIEKPNIIDHTYSTTRPRTLPPKNIAEEQKHLREHQEMIEAYKEKVIKEENRKKRRQEALLQREVMIQKNIIIWENDIIPNWDVKKHDKETSRIWWLGLPAKVRGIVWFKTLTPDVPRESFKEYLAQASIVKKIIKREDLERKKEYLKLTIKESQEKNKESIPQQASGEEISENSVIKEEVVRELVGKERSVAVITLDLPRTFPALAFFQPGGPCHNQLKHVLEAFVCSRTDLGYVQGMSYLAAIFLLYMDEFEAFQCMCGLFQRRIFTAFYTMELESIQFYTKIFSFLLRNYMPELYNHLEVKNDVTPHIYFLDWVLTLFTKSIPIDVAAHLLDVYLLEGEYFLYKAGLGILYLLKSKLLSVEFDGIMQTLQQLTSLEIDDTELFQHINCVELDRRTYEQVVDKIEKTTFL